LLCWYIAVGAAAPIAALDLNTQLGNDIGPISPGAES
jgi:hypothetical protein